MPRKILISAGESSGDLAASGLVQALKRVWPDADFFGCAGPQMRAEGVRDVIRMESLNVVGLVEVLQHIPRIYGEFRKLGDGVQVEKPKSSSKTGLSQWVATFMSYTSSSPLRFFRSGAILQMRPVVEPADCYKSLLH